MGEWVNGRMGDTCPLQVQWPARCHAVPARPLRVPPPAPGTAGANRGAQSAPNHNAETQRAS
eukprot:4602594-Lingulodinium_polyedra.AAC.1